MDLLPVDTLADIFAFLDAPTCLHKRQVCRLWRRTAGKGCVLLSVKYGVFKNHRNVVGSVTLVGRRWEGSPAHDDHASSGGDDDILGCRSASTDLERTRGRLMQPRVLTAEDERDGSSVTFVSNLIMDLFRSPCRSDALARGCVLTLVCTSVRNLQAAFKVQPPGERGTYDFQSLNVEASSFEEAWRARAGHPTGPIFDEILERTKPRLLKKALCHLDLSGLHRLKRLSVRGCTSLEILCLPDSLTALDASGCTLLGEVTMALTRSDGGLVAVNLSGCRNLQNSGAFAFGWKPSRVLFGPSVSHVLRITRELDLSSAHPGVFVAEVLDAIRSTTSLVTVSMRYVATSNILVALADSVSAKSTALRFVDVAFSSQLTDLGVVSLAKNASRLERLNMRGCSKVSTLAYNEVPVFLEKRRSGEKADFPDLSACDSGQGEASSSDSRKRRKGDSVFYFVGSGPTSKPKSGAK